MASKQLIISYAIDWLVIMYAQFPYSPSHHLMTIPRAATIISLLLSTVNPDFHTFCVLDLSLSYSYRAAKLGLPLFVFFSVIFPIITITLIYLFPPLQQLQVTRQPLILPQTRTQKLKSLNASLLGLGVSLATSTVILTGVKNLTGKPRPNFLSICDPDLENIGKFKVGGFGEVVSRLWIMVDVEICRQGDKGALRDGFRSFPSGYSISKFFLSLGQYLRKWTERWK
jgi:hypothetical protein